MRAWIIYKNGIGFSRIIAEMLQDRLEDYVDVNVGKVENIDPSYLLEEKVDLLIVGDIINENVPNLKLKNWLLNYMNISDQKSHELQYISGYYITLTNAPIKPSWIEIIQNDIRSKQKCLPILHLKLDREICKLENESSELIKNYSNDIIECIVSEKN